MYRRLTLISTSALALLVAAPQARAADVAGSGATSGSTGVEEVVVTARRRAETAQTTPISVSALSATALKEQNIQVIQDLNAVVPGFRFSSEGGKNTNNVVMRGLARIPLGLGIPAVVTYFADVPLPGVASNVPAYDLQNIQVLKGPQGTLFGRNTLGGAVVITPVLPNDEFGGYGDAQIGNLGRHIFDGAVNIPIIEDKLSVRISGQIQREDGYVKNLSGGPDLSDTDNNSWRVAVVAKPTDYITNTFIYDYTQAAERASGAYLYDTHPGIFQALFTPSVGSQLGGVIGNSLDSQIASYRAQQLARGPRVGWTDVPDGGFENRRLQGLSNDTRFDITDTIRVRNILGYRKAYNNEEIDSTGTPTLNLFGQPFKVFDAGQTVDQEFITDELQLLGKSFNNRLNWIVGGFFNHDYAAGPAGSQFSAFNVPAPEVTATVEDHNYAAYAQVGLDLSDWVLQGLTFNLGYRYSWDVVHACGGTVFADRYASQEECETASNPNVGTINARGNDPSWTIGLDYKYSDKQFFYVTSRHGYRGVNVNTPLFSSPYTTGQVNAACIGGVCPDLRPFQTTKPEKLTDVEIGSKTDWEFGSVRGRFDIAGFWSEYKNALQFLNTQAIVPGIAPDSPTNGSIGVNAADETIMGVEVGTTVRPTSSLTVTFNGSYTQSSIDRVSSPSAFLTLNKNQITLPTPKLTGSADVRWTLPYEPLDGSLVMNADIFGTQKFGAQYGQDLPGYSVTNARLSWNGIAGSNLDLALFVRNIFDKTYYSGAVVLLQSFPVNTAIIGEPRTYGIDLRYTF